MTNFSEELFAKTLTEFKKDGGRITDQRRIIVEVILQNPSSSCKELFYLASKKDSKVSRATVYRTVRFMEQKKLVER